MKRLCKITVYALLLGLILLLGGCGRKEDKLPTVALSIWTDEESVDLLKEELADFQEEHKEEANFDFTISVESVATCKMMVLTDPKAAADIYTFADDQFEEIYNSNALLKFTKYQDEIIASVGGPNSGAAQAITKDGDIYCCPLTAGNGYFLYYNKAYLSEEDVKSLDRILEVAAKNDKKFTMDYGSGWYIYSFFKAAGLEVGYNDDETSNMCNWNAVDTKYTGVDVLEAMARIAANDGFVNCGDEGFVDGVTDGTIIAGINGAWNASKVQAAWGEDYAATKLPTYTLNNDQIQMCSFTGYKMMGINAYTEYPDYCMKLVRFLTNEENQLKLFELTGECPANLQAAANEKVQNAPAIAALALQSQYGYVQRVADNYWDASSKLGIIMASGNLDNRDLQELLDDTQREITAPSESNN